MIRLANVDEEVQTHDTDITNLDETMTMLQVSMSDLEDIVDSVEDDVTALNVENDEIQQRLTVLEETLIGTGCSLRQLPNFLFSIVFLDMQLSILAIDTIVLFSVPWVACASSPCDNEGTCVDVNVDTFVCMCRDGYFGETCQYGQQVIKSLIP